MVEGRPFRSGRLIVGFGVVMLLAWAGMLLSAADAAAVGSISGTVTDATTEAPIEEVEVCAYGEGSFECEYADEGGEYTLPELDADEYLVEFWAPYLGYLTQYYNGKSSWEEADLVTVADEPVTGVDAALTEGGRIQGTVTDAASNAPVEGVEVCAYSEGANFLGCAFSESSGDYTIRALAAGEYLVEFWAPWLGYLTQFYNGKENPTEADLVSVSLGGTVTGVDARLAKPAPPTPIVTPTPPPPAVAPPVTQAKPKPRRCRKGFRRKRVKGKVRCVKVKKRRGRRRKNS